jgi:hypothetical protein
MAPGLPEPATIPFDPVKLREWMRAWVAIGLLIILLMTLALPWIALAQQWVKVDELMDLLGVLIAPVVGLVGAVTGFYYGEQKH